LANALRLNCARVTYNAALEGQHYARAVISTDGYFSEAEWCLEAARGPQLASGETSPLPKPQRANLSWSMDFVSPATLKFGNVKVGARPAAR